MIHLLDDVLLYLNVFIFKCYNNNNHNVFCCNNRCALFQCFPAVSLSPISYSVVSNYIEHLCILLLCSILCSMIWEPSVPLLLL